MRNSRWRHRCRSTSLTLGRHGNDPANENTNGLIREYLPKGIEITSHQPYLNMIADELNNRPRQTLGFLTPKEVFERLLTDQAVA